jgi:hypothetical protein
MALVETGEAHVAVRVPPQDVARIEREPRRDRRERLGPPHHLHLLQPHAGAVHDVRVRQALNYAVDKEEIAEFVFGGAVRVERRPDRPRRSSATRPSARTSTTPSARANSWPKPASPTASPRVQPHGSLPAGHPGRRGHPGPARRGRRRRRDHQHRLGRVPRRHRQAGRRDRRPHGDARLGHRDRRRRLRPLRAVPQQPGRRTRTARSTATRRSTRCSTRRAPRPTRRSGSSSTPTRMQLIWDDAAWLFLYSESQLVAVRDNVEGLVIHPTERFLALTASLR